MNRTVEIAKRLIGMVVAGCTLLVTCPLILIGAPAVNWTGFKTLKMQSLGVA